MDRLLKSYFEPFFSQHPGVAIAAGIVQDGSLTSVISQNVKSESHSTVMRIASMTKCFAAAAILILRDEGKLRLSDPVTNFLPDLLDSARFRRTTIYHLLTMQSGLPIDDPWADRQLERSDTELDPVLKGPFMFAAEPGEEFHYSNLGYMLLGRIVTLAAGEHSLSFISRRLLAPLGMTRSAWNLPGEGNRVMSDTAVFGGLCSTLEDLARWMDFIVSATRSAEPDKWENVLKSSSRRELQRCAMLVPPRDSTVLAAEPVVYALGLRRFPSGKLWLTGHSGGLPGLGSHFRWSNELNFGVIAWGAETYCPVWNPCRELLAEIVQTQEPAPPEIRDLVRTRAGELIQLVCNWNDSAADLLFASNYFEDVPREEVRRKVSSLELSHRETQLSCVPERGLGGKLLIDSTPVLLFTLSPAENGRIQEVKFL